ncbi:hypothetical protein [Rossellomorea sp. NRS-1567]|uniref:hypothetical protein n=1 Tax=Rossellomorea sp. NRS-1567 TaxID=3233901 RepID=UPI003D2BFA89
MFDISTKVYDRLEEKISNLKEILSRVDTENLVGIVANEFGVTNDIHESIFTKTELSSPFKQYLFLMGLLLSTKDLSKLSERENPPMEKIKNLLNEITDSYAELFLPGEGQELDEQSFESRKVSLPVFLNYFNTNSLTYEEQDIERIKDWFTPFDEFIREKIGIRINQLVEIFKFIQKYLQKGLDDSFHLHAKVIEEREQFFNYMKEQKVSFEQAKEELHLPYLNSLRKERHIVHQIKIEDLKIQFGEEVANSFVKIFSMNREEGPFFYYTELNPFEASPMWAKSEEILFVPQYKQIIHAIQIQLTLLMEDSEHRERFYRNRDKQTEKKTLEIFRRFFKDAANYYTSVYENEKSENEHDLLIQYRDTIFIIEVKASKMKEPFRDPDKAYIRIKRDFNSDGGIQKGYDQGLNLKNLILENEVTTLYDSNGNEIVKLSRNEIKKIFIIVVTAENFGILSSNLSYLLEKPEEEPYPWACCLHDLETALDGIVYINGTAKTFIQYLYEREEFHENFITSDELEILGYFLENGSFKSLDISESKVFGFDPDFSNFFDEIYYEKRGMTPKRIVDQYKDLESQDIKTKKRKNKKRVKKKQSKASKKNNRKN